jgi:hypothetical protein
MSESNLQRDMHWLKDPVSITWPTSSTRFNSDGVAYDNVGYCYSYETSDASATNTYIGLMMTPPEDDEDHVCYKIRITQQEETELLVARATSQTGANDTFSTSQRIMLQPGNFETIVAIQTDGFTDPIVFAVKSIGTSTQQPFNMSVQRLNTAPPTFQSRQA